MGTCLFEGWCLCDSQSMMPMENLFTLHHDPDNYQLNNQPQVELEAA